jgi:MFS family permease
MLGKVNSNNKRFTHILPFILVMYTIAYIDRNNVGFGFSGMEKSLNISPTMAGMAGGIFFLGYLLLQIPAGYIAKKYGARKLLFGAQLIWGILAVSTGFVQNANQLLIIRFCLGLAESALFPSILILVTEWFPASERARANGFWQMGANVAGLIVGPLSGLIMTYASWRGLFIIEGFPAIIWAIVCLILLVDNPKKAKFLSKEESDYLKKEFAEDAKNMKPASQNWRQAFLNIKTWALVLSYFALNVGGYGVTMWMPTILKNATQGGFGFVGLLTSFQTIVGIIVMYCVSQHSDKTGEKKWHAALSIIGGAAMLLLSVATQHNVLISIGFVLFYNLVAGFTPIFWTFPAMLIGEDVLGPSLGFINGIGNLGGFFGATIIGFIVTLTGNAMSGLIFAASMWILSGVIILCLKLNTTENINETTKINQATE